MPSTPRLPRLAWVVIILLIAVGGWFAYVSTRPWRPRNEALLSPAGAIAALKGPATYCNGAARAFLQRERPSFVPEPARDHQGKFSLGMVQAVQDPRLFRELDRQSRFDEVWLLGDPSLFKPLLEHLLETRDFTLAYVDHTSLVFRRGGEAWTQAAIDALAARFTDPHEKAYVQSMVAIRLLLVRQTEPALKLLEAAQAASSRVADVQAGWSTYWMIKGRWDKALDAADRTLALDRNSGVGIACRAQALFATKRFSDAWNEAERLLAMRPDEPTTIFYHAKLAHEAHAYQSEIESLKKLIALGEQAGANVSGYRVYLAQSYACVNDADNAMDQVTLALLDTSLPREQRRFADELLSQVQRSLRAAGGMPPH